MSPIRTTHQNNIVSTVHYRLSKVLKGQSKAAFVMKLSLSFITKICAVMYVVHTKLELASGHASWTHYILEVLEAA